MPTPVVYKFHETAIRAITPVDEEPEYVVKGLRIHNLRCCVCGVVVWRASRTSNSPKLFAHHTVHLGEYHYILPRFHYACKELFDINPLPYTDPQESSDD